MDANVALEVWWMLGVVLLMVAFLVAAMIGKGKSKN